MNIIPVQVRRGYGGDLLLPHLEHTHIVADIPPRVQPSPSSSCIKINKHHHPSPLFAFLIN